MPLLDVHIISNGATYYLINSSGTPTSGGAATAITTTPYSFAARDWSLANANAQMIMSGGPPFQIGSQPLFRGYDVVQETVTIGMMANSADNAVFLIRQLHQILNVALYSTPAVLYIQPLNNTSPILFEIYAADVQPIANEEWRNVMGGSSGSDINVAVRVTWLRSPFGGRSSLTTLINSVAVTNTGISDANVVTLGALTGDLIYEGQPLNIRSNPSASNTIHLLSTIKSHTAGASITGNVTTTSTSFVPYGTGVTVAASGIRDNRGVKLRVLLRFKPTLTNPSKARIRVSLVGGGGTHYVFPVRALGTDTSGQLLDVGDVDLSVMRNSVINGSTGIVVNVEFASVDGTSVTINLDYSEVLLYYDFATIITPFGTQPIYAAGAQNINGQVWLPQALPSAFSVDSTNSFLQSCQVRGTIPRAFSGASLWMALLTATTLAHNTAHTSTILANLASLYRGLRGGG